MNNLLTAIRTKLVDSDLYSDVNGRVFLDQADSPDYPRVVYSIISTVPDRTFGGYYRDVLIQFSLFSAKSAGMTVMTTMYNNLIALFDEQSMDITGYTLVIMKEENLVTMTEILDKPLPDGSTGVLTWHVDFTLHAQKA